MSEGKKLALLGEMEIRLLFVSTRVHSRRQSFRRVFAQLISTLATSSNLPPLLNDYRISVVENPGEFKTETKRAGIQMEEYFELGCYHRLKRFTFRLRIALCIAFL